MKMSESEVYKIGRGLLAHLKYRINYFGVYRYADRFSWPWHKRVWAQLRGVW